MNLKEIKWMVDGVDTAKKKETLFILLEAAGFNVYYRVRNYETCNAHLYMFAWIGPQNANHVFGISDKKWRIAHAEDDYGNYTEDPEWWDKMFTYDELINELTNHIKSTNE